MTTFKKNWQRMDVRTERETEKAMLFRPKFEAGEYWVPKTGCYVNAEGTIFIDQYWIDQKPGLEKSIHRADPDPDIPEPTADPVFSRPTTLTHPLKPGVQISDIPDPCVNFLKSANKAISNIELELEILKNLVYGIERTRGDT